MKKGILGLAMLGGLMSCNMDDQPIMVFSLTYDFSQSDQGWKGDFADYPEGDSLTYELFFKHDTLPTNLNANATKKALHVAGSNMSDDLFMFVKHKIAGLRPNTTYEVLFNVRLASNAPTGAAGIGGAPGESVFLKAGATPIEPLKVLEDGMYRMNIDKGNQGEAGDDMIILGHIGVAATTQQFQVITRNNSSANSFLAATNEAGELWLIIGTDSGFEGRTTIYYTQVDVLLNQISD